LGLQTGFSMIERETLIQGRRAFERGEDALALETLSRLTGRGFEYADVFYMIGLLQERADDLDAALESLRRAVRINPSYVEALLALATLHERRGDFDRSQGYAERASRLARPTAGGLDPTTRGKLSNQQAELADALARAGERGEAIEEYRRALERCPDFPDIRHRLGVTLREAGLPAQAVPANPAGPSGPLRQPDPARAHLLLDGADPRCHPGVGGRARAGSGPG